MNKVIKRCEGCDNNKKCIDEAMAKIVLEEIQPLLDKAQVDVEIVFTMVVLEDGTITHEMKIYPEDLEDCIGTLYCLFRENFRYFNIEQHGQSILSMLEKKADGGSVH